MAKHLRFLLIGWFYLAAFFPVSAEESAVPPLTPQQLIEYDRFEWRTIILDHTVPPSFPIPAIQQAIEGRTTILVHPEQQWLAYQPETFRHYPFLHLEMCEVPAPLSLKDQLHWRDFFNTGGTLYLDACDPTPEKLHAWKQWGQSIYPETEWEVLNQSHVLSFSFYLLEKRMLLSRTGSPIHLLNNDGRFILILNEHPQWSWEQFKKSAVTKHLNHPTDEIRLRFYVNLMMYLLTGNYKSDQLHLPTILLRRK